MKKRLYDIEIPWYLKYLLKFWKPKFKSKINEGIEIIRECEKLDNNKYVIDGDFDIKKKKFKVGIKFKF